MGYVHFKDVALAHILLYETKSASGRHLCVEYLSNYGDFVAKIAANRFDAASHSIHVLYIDLNI